MTSDTAHRIPLVSVVIGFKDWGLERLELSVRSIHDSLEGIDHEVVISDYGSEDSAAIADAAQRVDAVHEIVETNGEWSRSRALNAGVRASRGEIILATDADMLFTPRALRRVVEQLDRHPQEVVILQCRDLPVGYSHEVVAREGFDWRRFTAIGQIRPRWGMGGLVGVRRELWGRLRGWDERMHTYGGEDVDFGKRAQKIGARIDWLDEPGVGMFHIWHPSSGASAARSAAATAAIAENRRIHTEDNTFARNRVNARYLPDSLPPLVSVLLAPGDDLADLRRTVASLLHQTVTDIEVIVHGVAAPVSSDPRVRSSDGAGPSGTFVTCTSAGDVWGAERLEHLLSLWQPGAGLLSDVTSQRLLDVDGSELTTRAALRETLPDARSTLVRRELLRAPAEVTPSGWSAAVQSVAATGARWVVSPESRRITTATLQTDESLAARRAQESRELADLLQRCGLVPPEMPKGVTASLTEMDEAILHGTGVVVDIESHGPMTEIDTVLPADVEWRRSTIRTSGDGVLSERVVGTDVDTLDAISIARAAHDSASVRVGLRSGRRSTILDGPDLGVIALVESSELVYGTQGTPPHPWIAVELSENDGSELLTTLRSQPSSAVVLDRVVEADGQRTPFVLARRAARSLDDALVAAAAAAASEKSTTVRVVVPATHRPDQENAR